MRNLLLASVASMGALLAATSGAMAQPVKPVAAGTVVVHLNGYLQLDVYKRQRVNPAQIRHHIAGGKRRRGGWGIIQRGFQRVVLRFQRHRHRLPLQQAGVLGAQMGIFGVQREQMPDRPGPALCRLHRRGDDGVYRGQQIIQPGTQPVGKSLVCAADKYKGKGEHQHHREGEARYSLPERDR